MPTPLQLKLIHVAARQVGLNDAAYRVLLRNVADAKSAKDLGQAEYEDVMAVMEDQGFRTLGQPDDYWRGKVRRRDFEAGPRMVRKIEAMAAETNYKVAGLCMRFSLGRTDRVEQLSPLEAYNAVEMLKAVIERRENEAAVCSEPKEQTA